MAVIGEWGKRGSEARVAGRGLRQLALCSLMIAERFDNEVTTCYQVIRAMWGHVTMQQSKTRSSFGKLCLAAAFCSAILTPTRTLAVIKVATYTGIVEDGYDYTGEFGRANTDLTGDTFVARYVYDTSLGYTSTSGHVDEVYGGSLYGIADPLISASVKINGVSHSFYTGVYGLAYINPLFTASENVEDYDDNYTRYNYLESALMQYPDIPGDLDTNFSAATFMGDYQQSVQIDNTIVHGVATHYALADASAITVTVTDGVSDPIPGVPEASAWVLMIAGFGAVGIVKRRRVGSLAAVA